MKATSKVNIPVFPSFRAEKEYWEARGPLAEGNKGKIHRPKPGQKRSSFLAVRLTGEELTRLRDMAAKQGLGPSTFARLVLTRMIENENRLSKAVTSDELKNLVLAKEAIERYIASYKGHGDPVPAESGVEPLSV